MGVFEDLVKNPFKVYINAPEDTNENACLFTKLYNDVHKDKKTEMKVIKKQN